jgi:energy-coupling factor transporter transmembrane protein EcfT
MLFLIILILSYAAGFFMPWWVAAIVAFLAALWIGKTPGRSFWSGFFGVAFVWLALALFKTVPNDHILATRVAHMFTLPGWGYLLASRDIHTLQVRSAKSGTINDVFFLNGINERLLVSCLRTSAMTLVEISTITTDY